MALTSAEEDRKYFQNTISPEFLAPELDVSLAELAAAARTVDTIQLDMSLVGSSVVFLYRSAGKLYYTRCKITLILEVVLSLAGEDQTLVILQRQNGTSCGLGLNTTKYWTRAKHDELDFLWFVQS